MIYPAIRPDSYLISLVVPVYNEEENVVPFYERATQTLHLLQQPYELIFVNDGSRDYSVHLLAQLAEQDAHVKIVDLSRNFGKEAALSAGLDYALGEIVIPIDADLQHPPEVIPEMIQLWRQGYDMVYAARRSREEESWLKQTAARLFYKVINRLSAVDIPENAGDFRLISRCVLESIRHMREKRRFMKGMFSWVGFKQGCVYYETAPRYAGKTKWNYWTLWNLAMEGITAYSIIPLQASTYIGLLLACGSFAYGGYFLLKTLLYGNPVRGYPSLLVLMLFLSGMQLMVIGIMGEYIGRIYVESKNRPLYLVRHLLNFNHQPELPKTSYLTYNHRVHTT